jgi:hypothetical protein
MLTFEQFMREKVSPAIETVAMGLDQDNFADAPWHDLYRDTNGNATDAEICECLAEYDDLFTEMLTLAHTGGR